MGFEEQREERREVAGGESDERRLRFIGGRDVQTKASKHWTSRRPNALSLSPTSIPSPATSTPKASLRERYGQRYKGQRGIETGDRGTRDIDTAIVHHYDCCAPF